MVNKGSGKPYKCDQCHYSSNRSFDLRRHKRRHTRIRPIEGTAFKCSECTFTTKWKRNMNRHMEIHNRTPADDTVDQSFEDLEEPADEAENEETFEELIVELIDETGSSKEVEEIGVKQIKVFVCGQCQYTTNRAVDLRRHEQTHSRVKIVEGIAYKCLTCPFLTKWKRNIVRHTKKHLNLHTEQLDDLSSEELVVELIKSEDIRSDDETDTVNIVQSQSAESRPSVLNRNSPVTARDCFSPCDDKFEYQWPQLTSEAPQLTDEKRFKCTQCDYQSKRAFDLRRHEQRHKKVKIVDGTAIKCPECSFVTKWKRNMTRHMQKHKPKDTPAETNMLCEQFSGVKNDVEFQTLSIEPLDSETVISDLDSETTKINELIMDERRSKVEIEFLLSDEDPDILPTYWNALEEDEESAFGT